MIAASGRLVVKKTVRVGGNKIVAFGAKSRQVFEGVRASKRKRLDVMSFVGGQAAADAGPSVSLLCQTIQALANPLASVVRRGFYAVVFQSGFSFLYYVRQPTRFLV